MTCPGCPKPLPSCPLCDGVGRRLGALGRLIWIRCRSCGFEYTNAHTIRGS